MSRRLLPVLVALALGVAACTSAGDAGQDTTASDASNPTTTLAGEDAAAGLSYAGTQAAPEFPSGLDWLNTGRELSLEQLRGKVALLDFWTYGCINCIHIIPDLERLESEYPDELVVIGVHSAKFTNESATENIRQVILRYGLEHPVVNDQDFEIWNAWGVRAWPTTVLIDPAGNVVGSHAGEGVYDIVQPIVASLTDEFDSRGELDRSPLELNLEATDRPQTVLSFPGKVLADPETGRVFIADTGHHRIVVVESSGDVRAVYGAGMQGYEDGAALEARFNSPQGLALSADGRTLYVADTGNHAIRAVDLTTGAVVTAAGTGRLGWPPTTGAALEVDLNSPWDLARAGDVVYVAMAGTHQIWSFDVAGGTIGPLVGNARESTKNGPLADAELAQPSGLALDERGRLYIADAESSSIRFADVTDPDGITGTLAGSDQSLFEFGDEDGLGTTARLQHPLAVVYDDADDMLIIADTYNSKIKRIDPIDGSVTTWLGTEQGWTDGADPRFFEPGGLSLAGDTLYVADTNNHAIRLVDVATGTTETLVVKGIERFEPPPDAEGYRGTIVPIDPVTAGPGPASFVLDVRLPDRYKVNEDAPSSVSWFVTGAGVTMGDGADRSLTGTTFPVEVAADLAVGESLVTADLTVIYCRDGAESLCFIEQLRFEVSVSVEEGGASARINLPFTIDVPSV
jgi:DNA-binding beta-propeller fold protein YncE